MRTRSSSADVEGFRVSTLLPGLGSSRSAGTGSWFHGKFQKLFRSPRAQDAANTTPNPVSTATDGRVSPGGGEEPHTAAPVVLTFQQNVEKRRFSEASQQLIDREERLFDDVTEAEPLSHHHQEVTRLSDDYKVLESRLLQTLRQSLSLDGAGGAAALTSAVKAVLQQDERDRLWLRRELAPPAWRPLGWKGLHDSALGALVDERLDNPTTPPAQQERQSSVERHMCDMGRQLVADLQVVVGVVKGCYPPESHICRVYTQLYHRTVSARVRRVADFGLDDKDCTFLLRWVNEYYPGILRKMELDGDESLGQLLPEELLKPLEEQHLSNKQNELRTFITRILEREKQKWVNGDEPEREDGFYDNPAAYDIIQFINGMVTSAEVVVGDLEKARRITCDLEALLLSFRSFQDEVVKQNRHNSKAFTKANLSCVQQFREVLEKNDRLFQENVRTNCLSVLSEMKESAHAYLLIQPHEALRPHYRKLGTSEWLNKPVMEQLLDGVQTQGEELQGLKPSCHKELIGRFHQEVAAEYVRRLLRGDVKLKNKESQRSAGAIVHADADKLHNLFVHNMGSEENWLRELLRTIAEVLTLQELPAIQMQVASLGSEYPDVSEKHVSALLKLKTNVSRADRKTVKETLLDTLKESRDPGRRPFFSKVQVRRAFRS